MGMISHQEKVHRERLRMARDKAQHIPTSSELEKQRRRDEKYCVNAKLSWLETISQYQAIIAVALFLTIELRSTISRQSL